MRLVLYLKNCEFGEIKGSSGSLWLSTAIPTNHLFLLSIHFCSLAVKLAPFSSLYIMGWAKGAPYSPFSMLIPCLYLVCGLVACQKGGRWISLSDKELFLSGWHWGCSWRASNLALCWKGLLEILTAQWISWVLRKYKVEEAALLCSTGYAVV